MSFGWVSAPALFCVRGTCNSGGKMACDDSDLQCGLSTGDRQFSSNLSPEFDTGNGIYGGRLYMDCLVGFFFFFWYMYYTQYLVHVLEFLSTAYTHAH